MIDPQVDHIIRKCPLHITYARDYLKDTKELTVFSNISKKHFNILIPAKAKSLNVLSDNRRQARHIWSIIPGKDDSDIARIFSQRHLHLKDDVYEFCVYHPYTTTREKAESVHLLAS